MYIHLRNEYGTNWQEYITFIVKILNLLLQMQFKRILRQFN